MNGLNSGAVEIVNGESILNIRNAQVFLDQTKILSDINWEIRKGENWFILGSNGAGKTTLVKLIMGLVWPVYGAEVSVLGNTYGRCNLSEIRKKIAWVSPFLQSWTGSRWTALEVVISGIDGTVGLFRKPHREEIEKASSVMTSLECKALSEHSFEQVSSGEQVKILIARALMTSPELIILDEACVHLDLKSREFLLDTIENFASEKNSPAIIFITQRIEDISPVFGHGLILKNGRIILSGKRETILMEENLFSAFDMRIKLHRTADGRYWSVLHK